jgi:hypothetical protein
MASKRAWNNHSNEGIDSSYSSVASNIIVYLWWLTPTKIAKDLP